MFVSKDDKPYLVITDKNKLVYSDQFERLHLHYIDNNFVYKFIDNGVNVNNDYHENTAAYNDTDIVKKYIKRNKQICSRIPVLNLCDILQTFEYEQI